MKGAVNVLPDEAWESFRFNRASVKVEYLLLSDIQAQQATIQRLAALVKERKPWEEIVKSSGLKPLSTEFFTWTQEVKRVPDQDTFKEAALALEKGEVSSDHPGNEGRLPHSGDRSKRPRPRPV